MGLNYEKAAKKDKLTDDRIKYNFAGNPCRASKILALRLIGKMFDNAKPLFQWTDVELYYLGIMIRKEWRRRRNPANYEHGCRVANKQDRANGNARHPSITGHFLPHTFKK